MTRRNPPTLVVGVKERSRYISCFCIILRMTIAKYKSNRNLVYSYKYHVVFCPKYRRKVLADLIKAV